MPALPKPPIIALLGAAKGAFTDEFVARIRATAYADLSLAHSANVLRWLQANPLRMTELVAATSVTKQAVSQQVAYLADHGYLRVTACPTDQRAKLVELTDRGHGAQDVVHRLFREIERDWAARLGTDRYDVLRDSLIDLLTGPREKDPCAAIAPC